MGKPIPVEVAPCAVITCAVLEQSVDELVLPTAVMDCLRSMGVSFQNDDVAAVNPDVNDQGHGESSEISDCENENEVMVIHDHLLTVVDDKIFDGQQNSDIDNCPTGDNDAYNHENDDVINPYGVNVVTRSGLTTDCDNNISVVDDTDASCSNYSVSDDLMDNSNNDNDDQCDCVDADAVQCGSKLDECLQMSETRASLIQDQKKRCFFTKLLVLVQTGKRQFLSANWYLNEAGENSRSEFYSAGGS